MSEADIYTGMSYEDEDLNICEDCPCCGSKKVKRSKHRYLCEECGHKWKRKNSS